MLGGRALCCSALAAPKHPENESEGGVGSRLPHRPQEDCTDVVSLLSIFSTYFTVLLLPLLSCIIVLTTIDPVGHRWRTEASRAQGGSLEVGFQSKGGYCTTLPPEWGSATRKWAGTPADTEQAWTGAARKSGPQQILQRGRCGGAARSASASVLPLENRGVGSSWQGNC